MPLASTRTSASPDDAYLAARGLKTLALRIRQQNRSAMQIAAFLEGHDAVANVNYPGLPGNPQHARARQLFNGFGGMLSFELKGGEVAARKFFDAVQLPILAPSLGGVETLISHPATMTHAAIGEKGRRAIGITDGLVRLSVGIEDPQDIIADLEVALKAM